MLIACFSKMWISLASCYLFFFRCQTPLYIIVIFFFWILLNSNCYACDPFNCLSELWWCCCPRWKNSFFCIKKMLPLSRFYIVQEIPIAQQIPLGEPDSKSIFLHFYPRPVLAFGYCRCLRVCVCMCVCPCVRQSWVCPCDNSSTI